jgi:hypothetical protein
MLFQVQFYHVKIYEDKHWRIFEFLDLILICLCEHGARGFDKVRALDIPENFWLHLILSIPI